MKLIIACVSTTNDFIKIPNFTVKLQNTPKNLEQKRFIKLYKFSSEIF